MSTCFCDQYRALLEQQRQLGLRAFKKREEEIQEMAELRALMRRIVDTGALARHAPDLADEVAARFGLLGPAVIKHGDGIHRFDRAAPNGYMP